MAEGELCFDWDDANVRHLRRHHDSPLDLEYQADEGEARYKGLGATNRGRVLVVVWTVREHRIRAITAYAASRMLRRLYEEQVR
ncbi:MAG TPA: BrnT family toxin [Bryobacteraceae bacterium]